MLVVLFTDVVVVAGAAGGVVLCGLPFDRLLLCTLTNFRTTTLLLAALDEDEDDEDDDRVLAAQTGAIVVVVVGILSALGCRVTNALDGGLSSDRSEDGMISLPMSPSNAVAALLVSVNAL